MLKKMFRGNFEDSIYHHPIRIEDSRNDAAVMVPSSGSRFSYQKTGRNLSYRPDLRDIAVMASWFGGVDIHGKH